MENKTSIPLIGQKFPEFEAQTTMGKIKFPNDFKGSWVVLFSHPADFTPVCTTEFVAFQKRFKEFEELNTKLVGLSIDQVFSHIKWAEWIKEKIGVEIQFPIIADDLGSIGKMLGMIHADGGASTVRAVFVIDPKGIVRTILYYPKEIGRNMDEIVRIVKVLQISDKNGVAIPANWPNNELIKDRVIIPPASDVKTAEQRLNEYECYDWWFCHKELKE